MLAGCCASFCACAFDYEDAQGCPVAAKVEIKQDMDHIAFPIAGPRLDGI